MENLFNAAEIMDMGIEKEKKRRDFYGLTAEKFSDKAMKDLFAKLRDWEETHIKKFTGIKSGIKEQEATDSYPGELSEYIKALVDDKLYKEVSPASFSKNVKTPLSAIQYGIGFEKDAILFFMEMLPFMGANKGAVQKLIDEEKQHIVYLTELKRKLEG
ncbi:MAG: ferritin family protein [Candidatus Omnitrophota bacterium]